MLRIVVAPQHVPAQIDAGKVEEEEPTALFPTRESDIEESHAFSMNDLALREELGLVEHSFLQAVHVLGHALRVVETRAFHDFVAGFLGLRHRCDR